MFFQLFFLNQYTLNLMAVFGVVPDTIKLTTLQADSVAFATLLARRLILMNWKSAVPPTYRQWVLDLLHALKMKKIWARIHKTFYLSTKSSPK